MQQISSEFECGPPIFALCFKTIQFSDGTSDLVEALDPFNKDSIGSCLQIDK